MALGYDGVMHGGGALTGRLVRRMWEKRNGGITDEVVRMDRKKSLFLADVYNRFSSPLQNVIGQRYAPS